MPRYGILGLWGAWEASYARILAFWDLGDLGCLSS